MNKSLLRQVQKEARNHDTKAIASLLEKEDFHSVAECINVLGSDRLVVFTSLNGEKQAKIALALNYRSKRSILPQLPDKTIVSFLQLSDEDDAADILQFVSDEHRNAILEKLQDEKRKRIETLVKYHPETAGGLMDMNFIVVKPDFNLQDVAEKIGPDFAASKKIVKIWGKSAKFPEQEVSFETPVLEGMQIRFL